MKKIQKFLITLIKAQFFTKHLFIYILIPIFLALILSYINIWTWNIEKTIINLITIIWITWWLLLNFLTILLTDNSTILSAIKSKKDKKNIYWTFMIWPKEFQKPRHINYYYSMYYRIFFLIFSSIIFILLYIVSFLWLLGFIWYLDNNIKSILECINIDFIQSILGYWLLRYFLITIYLYFIMLYFISLLHLIFRLYYLFHDKNDFK